MWLLALASAAVVLAACNGSHPQRSDRGHRPPGATSARPSTVPGRLTAAERQWIDNAARFIDKLNEDVLLSANGGSDLASARRALHDESALYALVVAYTFFGGCGDTLHNLGTPTDRLRTAEQTMASACRRLERAAALFTRAATRSDPASLLAASQTALKTSPLIYRAKRQVDALRSGAG